ncbi:MAG: shikimate kinase [Christensenellaceae bacterium]|jgi:shikimate kinase|nr:shikimate kinase [Christensenellaceae bacterium]MBS6564061.1 shikimate kinase [Clostridiales bacterium]PWL96341.1 MAG: shikimate kinase [Selenomonadales bacterium]
MKKSNIVLIGMSGCGKTTIGRLTAQKLGMAFLDTDNLVEEAEGMSISRLFEIKGEEYFRQKETQACKEASGRGEAVIATGGGVVLSRENMSFLKAAGVIVYIERELDEILRADALVRPLFTSRERVSKMYYERERLYKGYADFLIKNDTPPEITAERLISMLEESRKG